MKKTCILLLTFLLIIVGCSEKMTKSQWEKQYKFTDINTAKATAEFQNQIKAQDQKMIQLNKYNKIQERCLIGMICALFVVTMGFFINLGNTIRFSAISLLISCGLGWWFTETLQVYGKWFSFIGLIAGIILLIIVLMIVIGSIYELVSTVEKTKKLLPQDSSASLFGDNGIVSKEIQNISTERIVDNIRKLMGYKK
jgi:hypothetical protein